jgi:hypothetical protein
MCLHVQAGEGRDVLFRILDGTKQTISSIRHNAQLLSSCRTDPQLLQMSSSKSKILLVYTMKVNSQFHTLASMGPWKEPLLPTGQKAGLSPELVWMLWWIERSLVPAGN